MLNDEQAEDLINRLLFLRNEYKKTNDQKIKRELDRHEKKCVADFKYLVSMKTGRYKSFSNYEDLNQEGFEALVKAIKTYKPDKGSFFAWAHHYIGTRISRSANLHTTIRYPLKVAKNNVPHKEAVMPTLIEDRYCPDKQLENCELQYTIDNAINKLTDIQQEIIKLAYGFDTDKPVSINKICKKFGISRANCIKIINNALISMKDNIKSN